MFFLWAQLLTPVPCSAHLPKPKLLCFLQSHLPVGEVPMQLGHAITSLTNRLHLQHVLRLDEHLCSAAISVSQSRSPLPRRARKHHLRWGSPSSACSRSFTDVALGEPRSERWTTCPAPPPGPVNIPRPSVERTSTGPISFSTSHGSPRSLVVHGPVLCGPPLSSFTCPSFELLAPNSLHAPHRYTIPAPIDTAASPCRSAPHNRPGTSPSSPLSVGSTLDT